MIVIRANTPDQALEQTILSLLQQAQIEAEAMGDVPEIGEWQHPT